MKPENPFDLRHSTDLKIGFDKGQQSMIDAGYVKLPTAEAIQQFIFDCYKEGWNLPVALHTWLKEERDALDI